MDKIIKHNFKKSFSDADIDKLCKGKVRIMEYGKLAEFGDIDDALGPHGALVLLYETRQGYGHWVSVFKKDNLIEFNDPYGLPIDSELQSIPKHFRAISNQNYPHLTYLIGISPYKFIENKVRLQQYKDDVSTCGRWAGLRIACRELPLHFYNKLFLGQKMKPDWYVTALTMFI